MKIFSNPKAGLRSRHGQYQIAVLGNIVAVSASGTASQTAIARYSVDMANIIDSFNGEAWAFLGFLHGPALLTQDAELELQKSIEQRADKGMKLGALVTGKTTIEALVKTQFERIYQNAGVKLAIFSQEAEAIAWLAERGFATDNVPPA